MLPRLAPAFLPKLGPFFTCSAVDDDPHSRQMFLPGVFGRRPGKDPISQNAPGVIASGISERRLSLSIRRKGGAPHHP
jgi:hypothetical protein